MLLRTGYRFQVSKKLETGQERRLGEDFHTPGRDLERKGRTTSVIAGEEKERTEWRNQSDSCPVFLTTSSQMKIT